MLRSLREVLGYQVRATDGDAGQVADFLFDDLSWIVRYLVVDIGGGRGDGPVLIPPAAVGQPDWEARALPVLLTRRQVLEAPPVEADRPVTRQMEDEVRTYYDWIPYWRAVVPIPVDQESVAEGSPREEALRRAQKEGRPPTEEQRADDPHLRSLEEVLGYHVRARDGDAGQVDDLVVEDEMWAIRYLVVDTGLTPLGLLPGRHVLLSPAWSDQVDWVQRAIYIDLRKETIEEGPRYDPSAPVNREYEARLYDYYGRPIYWQ